MNGDRTGIGSYLFASDARAPRRRRPIDAATLVLSGLVSGLLWWAMDLGRPESDARVGSLFVDLPGWLDALSWTAYTVSGVYAAGLVVTTVGRAGLGRGIARDVLLSVGAVTALALLEARSVDGVWPDVLPELFDHVDAPSFPAFRLAIVTSVVLVQGPHLSLPVRRAGRWVVVAAAASTLLLGFSSLAGVLSALLVAVAVAATVRLAFGSPDGLPPPHRLQQQLLLMGIGASNVEYDADQSGVVGRATAIEPGGRALAVKVYGRDAVDAQRAERLWRALWYRSAGPSPAAGQLRQVEHEALGLLVVAGIGCVTAELVTAGLDDAGDALLVTVPPPGAPVGASVLDDAALSEAWQALAALHGRRFAHGSIGPTSLVLDDGGRVGFIDLEACSLSASDQRLGSDAAALLATTAGAVGTDRAIRAFVDARDVDDVTAMLPYLQERALPYGTRRWVRDRGVDIDDLRAQLVDQLPAEAPALAQLQRITWSGVVMALFAIIAANAIITQIADVGLDTLLDELAGASVGWLVAALLIRFASYTTAWIGMQAMLTERLPLAPTTMLQSAKSFVGLVLPSTAGRVAMDVRFLQKLGTPTPVALAQGPFISIAGFIVEMALLLATIGQFGADLGSDDIVSLPSGGLVLGAVVLATAAIVAVITVPALRTRIVPPLLEALRSVKTVVSSPARLARIFGGELLDRVLTALTLAAVVAAFGAQLPFSTLIFVTVGTGLLAGLAPVPGGVGVAEAMLTGLLTTAGLAPELAFAVAISFRVITSYLPPVLGFFSFRYMTKAGYL